MAKVVHYFGYLSCWGGFVGVGVVALCPDYCHLWRNKHIDKDGVREINDGCMTLLL